MNVLTIAGIVVALVILFGAGLAFLFSFVSEQVTTVQLEQDREKKSYNASLTKGHKLSVDANLETQMKQARELASKKAALTPRWGNMHIQGKGEMTKAPSAYGGIEQDPMTAVKIAQFHTWQGVTRGNQVVQPGVMAKGSAGTVAKAPTPVTKTPETLQPGVDYPYIEITDSMGSEEKRKATIANSKAKSAAIKALKGSGGVADVGEAVAASPSTTASPSPASAPTAATMMSGGSEPVPGKDYPYIEITDSMSPEEKRKATIANSKAKSAAMKAFKAAGGAIGEVVETVAVAATPAPVPTPVATSIPTLAANVPPPPAYIEITDSMPPDEKRKATIANSKTRSAYMKSLKELGIDPSTIQ